MRYITVSRCTCPQLGGRKHAAFDIMVPSPLTPSILTAAGLSEGDAAVEAEARKHRISDSDWCASHFQGSSASHLAVFTSCHNKHACTAG